MTSLRRYVLAGSMACALVVPTATASVPGSSDKKPPEGSRSINVDKPEKGVLKGDGRYRKDGTAITVHDPNFVAPVVASKSRRATARKDAYVKAARSYLTARKSTMGLKSTDPLDLSAGQVRTFDGFAVVRFTQQRTGLPVYGSDIAVTVRDSGEIVYVSNGSVSNLKAAPTSRSGGVDKAAAIKVARGHLSTPRERTYAETATAANRVLFQTDSGRTVVAWKVIAGVWEILVDHQTGEILRAEDTSENAKVPETGEGKVFDPDPLSSAGAAYGDPGFSDNGNANSLQLAQQLRKRSLRGITYDTVTGKYSLKGTYASCIDHDLPRDRACPEEREPTFNFTRDDHYFDAVNAHYHLDTYMRYVNHTLGVSIKPIQYKGGVRFDPHGADGIDNSSFSRATDNLTFGQGGVDDAQDADVVIHELGHGLHHWVTGGNLSQVNGLSEGVGDYLAAGYSRDKGQWKPTDAEYHELYNWDGHNEFWSGRVTNWHLDHSYPDDLGGFYGGGQYFASCTMVARDAVGGKKMDEAVLTGLAMTGEESDHIDAAQAIIDAAAMLGNSAADIKAIGNAYNKSCNYGVTVPKV